MARPRKPTSELDLNGAFKKNPKRRAARRGEPIPTGPLGDPPDGFSREEKAIWIELASILPPKVAQNSDRWVVEVACKLMTRVRHDGIGGRNGVSVGELSQLNSCLTKLGMTPADRSKVNVRPDDPTDNPFADLAAEGDSKRVN